MISKECKECGALMMLERNQRHRLYCRDCAKKVKLRQIRERQIAASVKEGNKIIEQAFRKPVYGTRQLQHLTPDKITHVLTRYRRGEVELRSTKGLV